MPRWFDPNILQHSGIWSEGRQMKQYFWITYIKKKKIHKNLPLKNILLAPPPTPRPPKLTPTLMEQEKHQKKTLLFLLLLYLEHPLWIGKLQFDKKFSPLTFYKFLVIKTWPESVFSLKCWIRIRIKWIRIRNTDNSYIPFISLSSLGVAGRSYRGSGVGGWGGQNQRPQNTGVALMAIVRTP